MATAPKKTPGAERAAPAETRLRALEPIRADGLDHAPGALFATSEAAAEALIAQGAAEPVADAEAA